MFRSAPNYWQTSSARGIIINAVGIREEKNNYIVYSIVNYILFWFRIRLT